MEIIATRTFYKCAKSIAKRYRSFQSDYDDFVKFLSENPDTGVSLGDGLRKVRMPIKSKGKGKSGGCRVITLGVLEKEDRIFLVYIYDKSDADSVDVSVIKKIIKDEGLV